jgi:hypothetical protein
MTLSDEQLDFLRANRSAAMITVGKNGMPKVARVGIVMVDGRLWSSGVPSRVRTRRLRRDPRCTLFVFETGYFWLALETRVEILEGPETVDMTVRMFREMQNRPSGPLAWFGRDMEEDEFRQVMLDEERLIYEFHVDRAYGMLSAPG